MIKNINKIKTMQKKIPRYVWLIALRLQATFQPNTGSSLYKIPGKNRIPEEQKNWNSPIGTLRLSNHWNYENSREKKVYITDKEVPVGVWTLCINTGPKSDTPWKVLHIFRIDGSNILQNIDFLSIEKEIRKIC